MPACYAVLVYELSIFKKDTEIYMLLCVCVYCVYGLFVCVFVCMVCLCVCVVCVCCECVCAAGSEIRV
jgi:hypothetical protein